MVAFEFNKLTDDGRGAVRQLPLTVTYEDENQTLADGVTDDPESLIKQVIQHVSAYGFSAIVVQVEHTVLSNADASSAEATIVNTFGAGNIWIQPDPHEPASVLNLWFNVIATEASLHIQHGLLGPSVLAFQIWQRQSNFAYVNPSSQTMRDLVTMANEVASLLN